MQNHQCVCLVIALSARESLHKVKGKDRFDGKKSDILKIQGRQRGKKSDYFFEMKKDSGQEEKKGRKR